MVKMKNSFKKKGWGSETTDPFYYSKGWRGLREKYISNFPLDELKNQFGFVEAGEIVDHIIPRSLCTDLEFEWLNLQTLSFKSHQQKTAQSHRIDTLAEFIKEMEDGKLMYICTEEKRIKLLELVKQKGLY